MAKNKLSEVTLAENATDSINILIEEYGIIKRIPFKNVEAAILEKIVNGNDEEFQKTSEGLEYTLNMDGASYSVNGIGTCTDADIVIPATYGGKPVTSIEESAFKDCSSPTSIYIPNSVTSIGDGAFQQCTSLTSITIPSSVTSIGGGAFFYCTSLASVVIPDRVTSVREWAFAYCNSLTSITIPNSVTSISESAFYRCSALTSITIPDGVTSIGSKAFYMCDSLKSATFKGTPTSILADVFKDCNALTTINVPWSEGEIEGSPWGAVAATINFNYSEE